MAAGPRSTGELRRLPVVAQFLDLAELDMATAEHLLATLRDPGSLEQCEHDLDTTTLTVDVPAGLARVDDLLSSAPDSTAILQTVELDALLCEHLVTHGRDPAHARRRPDDPPARRWIAGPHAPPCPESDER